MARAYLLYSQAAALAPQQKIYWLRSQAVRTRAAPSPPLVPLSSLLCITWRPDPREGRGRLPGPKQQSPDTPPPARAVSAQSDDARPRPDVQIKLNFAVEPADRLH